MAIAVRSTSTSGTGDTNVSSKTVPVPTGAATGDIAIIVVEQWTSATERTATATGFTEITAAHATRATTGTAGTQTIRMFWKRLTAADTGNYTVTFSGTTWNMAHCVMLSGGLASGDPIEVVNTATATSGYPTTSFTVATNAALINAAGTFNAVTTTPPTSFTEQQDTNVLHTNTRILTATGSITASGGTSGETDTIVVVMIAVKPDSTGTSLTLGLATETDTAQSLVKAKTVITSIPLESDAAQALSYTRAFTLGVATETDSVQSLTATKSRTVSTATEAEQARGLSVAKTIIVGRGQETDTAIALNHNGATNIILSRAQETDAAPGLSYARAVSLGVAAEVDAAKSLLSVRMFALSTAAETDTAYSLFTVRRDITITALGEPGNAWAVTDLVSETVVTTGALVPAQWATTGTDNGWLMTGPESEPWTVSDPQL